MVRPFSPRASVVPPLRARNGARWGPRASVRACAGGRDVQKDRRSTGVHPPGAAASCASGRAPGPWGRYQGRPRPTLWPPRMRGGDSALPK